MKSILEEPEVKWGGTWTEIKLDAFAKYVSAYLNIMRKNTYWKTIYFDGFAGSGERKTRDVSPLYQQLMITEQEEKLYKGAAERVLTLPNNLSFDYHYFIDAKEEKKKKKFFFSFLFLLHPFGMQINWESIESLRDTRTDIWILVPTGVIV